MLVSSPVAGPCTRPYSITDPQLDDHSQLMRFSDSRSPQGAIGFRNSAMRGNGFDRRKAPRIARLGGERMS